MVSTPVSVQAQLLITRMLTRTSFYPRPVVEHIELFRHALEPHNILFGTAKINGQLVALPEAILAALRALLPSTETLPQRSRPAAAARPFAPARLRRT